MIGCLIFFLVIALLTEFYPVGLFYLFGFFILFIWWEGTEGDSCFARIVELIAYLFGLFILICLIV